MATSVSTTISDILKVLENAGKVVNTAPAVIALVTEIEAAIAAEPPTSDPNFYQTTAKNFGPSEISLGALIDAIRADLKPAS